ncbi:snoRNA-binding rRNA-processing protein [Elasticomyces elasticus]|nr:snoRNA-binding rRNA-processing protein [Elasticomyces elasticus]
MASAATARRHLPLAQDIETAGGRLRTKSITGKRKSRGDGDSKGDGYIDSRSSKKILAIAQELADEDAAERRAVARPKRQEQFEFDSRFEQADEEEEDAQHVGDDAEDGWGDEEEEVVEEDLDPSELETYRKFLPDGDELEGFAPSLANLSTSNKSRNRDVQDDEPQRGQTTNLADLILQRIAEKEAQGDQDPSTAPIFGGGAPEDAVEIPARVAETFTKVGQILSRYKSGPLPKPFKVLPTLPQWEDLLAITEPHNWTPHACYRATKIFISAPTSTGQFFIENVLLEMVKEDIRETKKLNIHLYNALKACFYRPAAFFKGFLFPLVESGCTLREANIISSVLAKIRIPVLHSAAAILRMCEISAEQTSRVNSEAAGSANIFIRVLLGKKYALPYKVVDALVFHFLRFRATRDEEAELASGEKLPVLWHQCFLVFAQTYRNEITEDQREALLDLLLTRGHKDIGAEIRRELLAGRNRGGAETNSDAKMDVVMDAPEDGDDTMMM